MVWDRDNLRGRCRFATSSRRCARPSAEARAKGADVVVVRCCTRASASRRATTRCDGLPSENVAARVAREVPGIDLVVRPLAPGSRRHVIGSACSCAARRTGRRASASRTSSSSAGPGGGGSPGAAAGAHRRPREHPPCSPRRAACTTAGGRLRERAGRAHDRRVARGLGSRRGHAAHRLHARGAAPHRERRPRVHGRRSRSTRRSTRARSPSRSWRGCTRTRTRCAPCASRASSCAIPRVQRALLRPLGRRGDGARRRPARARLQLRHRRRRRLRDRRRRAVGAARHTARRRGRPVRDTDTFTLALNNYRQTGGGGYAMLAGRRWCTSTARRSASSSSTRSAARHDPSRRTTSAELAPRAGGGSAPRTRPCASRRPARAGPPRWRRGREAPRPSRRAFPRASLRIIATNDFHGARARADARGVRRGAAAVAGVIERRASAAPDCECSCSTAATCSRARRRRTSPSAGRSELYNALGYAAAALGNHEFDWGHDTLRARMREARYAILGANVQYADGRDVAWDPDDTLVAVSGVRVGIIGVATVETPRTTLAANVSGLRFVDPVPDRDEKPRLRARGATAIVVVAHAGAFCDDRRGAPTVRRGDRRPRARSGTRGGCHRQRPHALARLARGQRHPDRAGALERPRGGRRRPVREPPARSPVARPRRSSPTRSPPTPHRLDRAARRGVAAVAEPRVAADRRRMRRVGGAVPARQPHRRRAARGPRRRTSPS